LAFVLPQTCVGGGGGLSDAMVAAASSVLKLPTNIPLDIAALVEPLSVAWHAISAAPIQRENTVLVLGAGPIGLSLVKCLVAQRVGRIIVAEVATRRREFAHEFGAHYVLDPKNDDVAVMSKEISGGIGPDVVFDAAGVSASLTTACTAVKARGTVVNVAIWEKEIPFQPNMLVFKEAKYTAVLGYQRCDWTAVLEHLKNGSLKPGSMITRKIKMENLVQEGILALTQNKDNHVKILVDIRS